MTMDFVEPDLGALRRSAWRSPELLKRGRSIAQGGPGVAARDHDGPSPDEVAAHLREHRIPQGRPMRIGPRRPGARGFPRAEPWGPHKHGGTGDPGRTTIKLTNKANFCKRWVQAALRLNSL